MHTASLFSLACLFAWTILAAPAQGSTVDCTNINPKKPFFLSVEVPNKKGNIVAQGLQEYDPFHSTRFELRAAGRHDFQETKFELINGRLTFNNTDQPAVLVETSQNVVVGKSLGFTTTKKSKGDFGLVDTDIPHGGDAGCSVTVGKKAAGFTLCDDSIGNPVLSWKDFSTKNNCVKVNFVARNSKP